MKINCTMSLTSEMKLTISVASQSKVKSKQNHMKIVTS